MGSPISFRDFQRKFKKFGVTIKTPRRGSHSKLVGKIDGVAVIYPFPVHKNKVDEIYVKQARKRFRLTPDDGVSDDEFNSA